MRQLLRSTWGKYLIALAAVAAALLIRGLIDPLVGRGAATVTLYGAIAVAVWAGGYKPGLLAAMVGYLAVNYFFIEPRGSISVENLSDVGRLLGFLLSALLIIALGGAMHGARERAEKQAETAKRYYADVAAFEREMAQAARPAPRP